MSIRRRWATGHGPPGPPPFAGITIEDDARCRLCRCPLGAHNRDPDGLCGSCAAGMRSLDGESLAALIAGVLLTEIGLAGAGEAEAIDLRQRLLELGVRASATEINQAIRKCRRRRLGLVIASEERHCGYRPVKVEVWQRPRKRPRWRRDDSDEPAESEVS